MLSASRVYRTVLNCPWRSLSATAATQCSSKPNDPAPLPTQADVVIIGGGMLGCSLLYHLLELGVTNTVLLEKDAITSGTTWHAAGIQWHLRTSEVESELLTYSWNFMKEMEEREGLSAGCQENGSIFVANSELRMNEFRRLASIGSLIGVESHILTPAETKALYPLMDVSKVFGAVHIPSDGGLDQSSLCQALIKGSTRRGGRVYTDTAVTAIESETSSRGYRKVKAVTTKRGSIETPCVVNCGGAWSPHIGQLAGVQVPLSPMRHAYIVTEAIPGVRGLPNLRHNDNLLYVRTQGDSLMIGGYEPNPIPCEAEPNFAFSLYELNWEVFEQHLTSAASFIPILNKTGVKSTICGPESFTPDHKPLMGESPELRGFYLLAGFNSGGIMSGPGFGKEMAIWVTRGRPNLDMYSYDIRRFNTILSGNDAWVRQRTHEAYAKNYSIRFDRDESLAGRNVIKDPLYEELLAKGCVYQERQGMERPSWFQPLADADTAPAQVLSYDYYGNYGFTEHADYRYRDLLALEYTYDFPAHFETVISRECHACRNRATLFNQSSFGKLYLTGPDAGEAANWIFSADVARSVGTTIYTCVLNRYGGIEGDLTVSVVAPGNGQVHCPAFPEPEGFYLVTSGSARQYMLSHLHNVLDDRGYNCSLLDHSLEMAILSLQGPESRLLLSQLTSADLSDKAFPFSSHQEIEVGGIPCRAMRLSFVGELGWELHVANEHAVALYRVLMEAGKRLPSGLLDAGYRAMDILSLEKGYKHWHADVRTDDTPLEAGMAFTCKLKGDVPFLGRRALEEARRRGSPQKRLVLFALKDRKMLHGFEPILNNGQIVGYLRRADFSPTLNKAIGYGYVKTPGAGQTVDASYLANGHWEIERFGQLHEASAHFKPLFDPQNLRLKGIYEQHPQSETSHMMP